jgi:hypothetical protein
MGNSIRKEWTLHTFVDLGEQRMRQVYDFRNSKRSYAQPRSVVVVDNVNGHGGLEERVGKGTMETMKTMK